MMYHYRYGKPITQPPLWIKFITLVTSVTLGLLIGSTLGAWVIGSFML